MRLLGSDVLGRLDPAARTTLIEAERIFMHGLNPVACLREIAQAFEEHVRARIVPLLRDSFDRGWSPSLWDIERVVEVCSPVVRERLDRAGLVPAAITYAIKHVRKLHGQFKHDPKKARLTREEAREIRETWFGLKPGEPGVFQEITRGPKS